MGVAANLFAFPLDRERAVERLEEFLRKEIAYDNIDDARVDADRAIVYLKQQGICLRADRGIWQGVEHPGWWGFVAGLIVCWYGLWLFVLTAFALPLVAGARGYAEALQSAAGLALLGPFGLVVLAGAVAARAAHAGLLAEDRTKQADLADA